MSEETDYKTALAKWKAKHGLDPTRATSQDELRMIAEEQVSTKTSWCLGCDKEMPVKEMKLITRAVNPYMQCDNGGGDYITPADRVRMCPECFQKEYCA